MKKKTRIHIVRHGQSLGNVDPQHSGPDPELTDIGKEQIRETARRLAQYPFDAIYSSHLRRAVQTAQILNEGRDFTITQISTLRERHFGDMFSLPDMEEQFERFRKILSGLPDDQRWHYKYRSGMESDWEATTRFMSAMKKIVQVNAGKHILIISHGNIMRNFLVYTKYAVFSEVPHSSVANGGYFDVVTDGEEFIIQEVSGLTKHKEVL
jgi:2,3-bisphosphoglycerate-dependent phosphoglycerate mutase